MSDIKIDGYNSGAAPSPAPAAAEFGKGASSLAEIKQATDARSAHSANLTREAAKQNADPLAKK